MNTESDIRFEWVVLKNVEAGYNLARWLLGDDLDAEDAVQDAALRAFKSFKSFRGEDGKSWFLAIVRNTAYNRLRQRHSSQFVEMPPEEVADLATPNPEESMIRAWESEEIATALNELPIPLREVLVLRELEEMSYKQIAAVSGLPIGTVMSRLARARRQLQSSLYKEGK